jgi:hypothetical protein
MVSLVLAATSWGACGTTSEIISNSMGLLAGSRDTLWVATNSQGGGVNFTTDAGVSWKGFLTGCHGEITDMAFGNRILAVILTNSTGSLYDSSVIWHYAHADNSVAAQTIAWPKTLRADTSLAATDITFAANAFFIASGRGGVLRWSPPGAPGALRGFLPGSSSSFDPASAKPAELAGSRVFAVDRYDSAYVQKVLVVTEPRLWLFNPADTTWDSTVTTTLATGGFVRFITAFVNNSAGLPRLYAFIRYTGGTDTVSLFRYERANKRWGLVLRNAPRAIAPAPKGLLYTIDGLNTISAYRDTVSQELAPAAGASDQDFVRRMLVANKIDKPESYNDLMFLPFSDTAGTFVVASSEGLFFASNEVPGVSAGAFTLLRRAKPISDGLRETYALPGILTSNYTNARLGYTVFVYKLARDADVTIGVYDYNLQLVKTVISRAPRKAAAPGGTGRSTDQTADRWDGTTTSGRAVAPGVYYYKISASTGERSFGKIVVAK